MLYKFFFCLLVFSDENNIYSKISCWHVRRSFQQVVSIIIQLNSNKQSWSSEAAVQKSLHSTLKKFAKFKWQHLHWSLSINSLPIRYCIKKRLRVFLWILQDIYEPYFSRNPPDNCFCIFHSSFFIDFCHSLN